ncbi:hypothetical protein [Streptomyces sp. BPTC-684]|uniref:AMIN-like domain-containing (lipo)protein n=1 Tax=Streptomyces sp. BPTC-684 TaxID=3043734 RepID=UPI0024B22347|nr:hypothetical protein [Streptomyces sp. BPTC-684]WHM37436.1 hypothetical protein QIY60_11320 [Streptomyces sp. BPTC-684]
MPVLRAARAASALLSAVAVVALVAVGPAQAAAPSTPSGDNMCILDARTGGHPDYDRLVFDVSRDTLPTAVHAEVSPDGTYSPGGTGEFKHLAITAKNYLLLDISPADGYAYTTPTVQPVSLPSLKGIQMTGGFEGHTTFGLSLGDYSRYKVSTLTSPSRIVIDIYH